MSVYNYDFKDNADDFINMGSYKGKIVIVVNTASRCGFTSNYDGFQELYKEFDPDLEVIAFPCNQFGKQEPLDDSQIKTFCNARQITYTLASKIEVNGDSAHPLYKYLKTAAKNGAEIDWNFEKFLIDQNGDVTHYKSDFAPDSFREILNKKLGRE